MLSSYRRRPPSANQDYALEVIAFSNLNATPKGWVDHKKHRNRMFLAMAEFRKLHIISFKGTGGQKKIQVAVVWYCFCIVLVSVLVLFLYCAGTGLVLAW